MNALVTMAVLPLTMAGGYVFTSVCLTLTVYLSVCLTLTVCLTLSDSVFLSVRLSRL